MGSETTLIAHTSTFVHNYAALGYQPDHVAEQFTSYAGALGLRWRDAGVLEMTHAEATVFESYLRRMAIPLTPEIHALRVAAVRDRVEAEFDSWGDRASDVVETLGLDYSGHDMIASIAHVIEERIANALGATAITFEFGGVEVDGVTVDYPEPVAEAITATARRIAAIPVREPF